MGHFGGGGPEQGGLAMPMGSPGVGPAQRLACVSASRQRAQAPPPPPDCDPPSPLPLPLRSLQTTETSTRSCDRCWACSRRRLLQAALLAAPVARAPRQPRPASRWVRRQLAASCRAQAGGPAQRTCGGPPGFTLGACPLLQPRPPALFRPPAATAAQAAAAQACPAPAAALEPCRRGRACRGAPPAPPGAQRWAERQSGATSRCFAAPSETFPEPLWLGLPALPLAVQPPAARPSPQGPRHVPSPRASP